MTMQKQTVPLPFTQGVDTKTDQKMSAKPSRLENAVFRGGTIQKRWGTDTLTQSVNGGGTISEDGTIFPFKSELVRISNGTTYGLSAAMNTWVAKSGGGHYNLITEQQLIRNNRSQLTCDQAVNGNLSCIAWLELTGSQQGLHIQVRDDVTGEVFQTGALAIASTSTVKYVRVLAVGNNLIILYADNYSFANYALYSRYVSTSTPQTLSAATTVDAGPVAGSVASIDGTVVGSNAYIAYGSVVINVASIDSVGAIRASPAPTTIASSLGPSAISSDSAGRLFIVYEKASNAGKYVVWDTSFGVITAETALGGWASSNRVTLVETSTAGTMTCFASSALVSVAGAEANTFYTATFNYAGTVSTSLTAVNSGLQNAAIATKAALFDGVVVVGITGGMAPTGGADGSSVQSSFMVMDYTGRVIVRCLDGASSFVNEVSASVATVNGKLAFLAREQGRLAFNSYGNGIAQNVTTVGITRVMLEAVSENRIPWTQLGDVVYLGGGCPRAYDGLQVVESGFHMFPEIWKSTSAGGGSLSAGTYQYKVLYSWLNANGELTRSIVSPPISDSVSASDKVTLVISSLPVTEKDSSASGVNVQVEIYRTEANVTVFYRASSPTAPTLNDPAASISYEDTLSDADLVLRELLYTTGGVLDNEPPPPYSCACAHKDRLIIGGLEDPYSWRSSNIRIEGEQLRFSYAWGGRVPADTGPITGVASMDGNIIILTSEAAYLVSGDGPDLLGNNNWPPPVEITSVDAGAVSPQSVVSTPAGIFFQSPRGIMLLDRSLNCEYIGADVEQFSDYTFRNATLLPDVNQVRFLVDNGTDVLGALTPAMVTSVGGMCLVFDYYYKQWSWFTNYGGQASCLFHQNYYRARSDGKIFKEVQGSFKDNAQTYTSVVETQWIKLAGIQGFQRLFRMLVLGTYGSNFTLNWGAAYDYVLDYSRDTLSLDGNGVYSVGGPMQLRRGPRIQKCESVKLLFWDSDISDNGQGMELTDLSVEVGIKGTAYKLPATKSI